MTEVSERYRQRAQLFTDKVEGVADDAWGNQSPCEDWTARDVVGHVVDTTGMFFGFIDQPPPTGPSVDDDPVGAWRAARDAVQAALEDPSVATKAYEGHFGPTTFEKSVGQFLSGDLVMHNWDLSRATGQDDTIDPVEVSEMLVAMEPMDELLRSPGAFGPKIEPPPGADEQTRLLCFLGRKV